MRELARRPLLQTLLVALLLLLMVLPFTACSEVSNSRAGEVESYSDPDYGYSFEYPADWELEKGDTAGLTSGIGVASAVGVWNPDGAEVENVYIDLAQVRVYELEFVVEESMVSDLRPDMEALLADLESQDPTWKVVEDLSETRQGGLAGYEITYSFAADGGTPAMCTFYFLFDQDIEYQLIVQAASENWESYQETFAAIIASFSPGTSQ